MAVSSVQGPACTSILMRKGPRPRAGQFTFMGICVHAPAVIPVLIVLFIYMCSCSSQRLSDSLGESMLPSLQNSMIQHIVYSTTFPMLVMMT